MARNSIKNKGTNFIRIKGAKVHNLKNIDLDIPKNKLIVITGISGSGKSSLAFDTLYAEGQRRYVESLSAYARQFLEIIQKPEIERIEGISPAISINQRKAAHNPRSTVGTMTEIYDYLRLLFGRTGKPHCPRCGKLVCRQTIDQISEQILNRPKETEIIILGPIIRAKKGEHQRILEEIQRGGFVRVRIDGFFYRTEEALELKLNRKKKHNIEVVVDRLILDKNIDKSRLVDSIETGLKLGKGIVIVNVKCQMSNVKTKSEDLVFSEHFSCQKCGISLPEIEPRLFSFNSPYGACPACTGLGQKLKIDPSLIIPNPDLSLEEGAIFPLTYYFSYKLGRQGYFWRQLTELAEKYNFSLDTPIKNLSQRVIDLILYGEKYLTSNIQHLTPNYEGIISILERKYHQTDSEHTRQEIEKYMIEKECEQCQGKRLKPEVLAVTVAGKSIDKVVEMPISQAKKFFEKLLANYKKTIAVKALKASEFKTAQPIIKEIINRLQSLIDVGLDYLSLDRKAETVSSGEEQRIRLASQIGSKLTGVLYILDEPSIGLHPRDQGRLIKTFKKLRELGNTIIVVEHDPQTIRAADWVIDIGPGAGKHGGRVIFQGTPKQLLKAKTLTGEYLSGKKKVEITRQISKSQFLISKQISNPKSQTPKFLTITEKCLRCHLKQQIRKETSGISYLIIKGAKEHNLKDIDVKIPLGKFVCITGVSGSGKSSLINDILARALMRKFYNSKKEPGKHKAILGTENLNKAVLVDQSPIGRTPRSNPATYTGCFSYIRDLFSKTREARIRGYQSGRFSFNAKGGRCETCQGQGQIKIEMYFLADVYVECQECKGKRFNKETLSIEYGGKNIAQVLEMTVEEALDFFKTIPGLYQKLKILNDVGLGYIQLGQPAPSLSGGEAQRVKLAAELSKKATGNTLYILDEPTTGLHPDDIKKLVWVLRNLVNKGNTVVTVEHNLDFIKNIDWCIDLGPEGGNEGGFIVAEGMPFEISKNKKSYTGKYLKTVL